MGRRFPAGRVLRVLAVAPLLLAGVLAGGGQAAAATAATCLSGTGGQPPPGPDGMDSFLAGVTVASACDVWAVGYQKTGTNSARTLIEHWTGGLSWATVDGPSPGEDSELTAVRAVSAADIWAVGRSRTRTGVLQTLILHWDGSAWTQKPSPSPGSSTNVLSGVAATSAASAWAVGSYSNSASGPVLTLILRWDGSNWTPVTGADPGRDNRLSAVSATSATSAWAVGTTSVNADGTGNQALIEHWDGSAWTRQNSAVLGGVSGLNAVAATAANNAWAVGSHTDSSGNVHAMIERWNGSSWAPAFVPGPAGPFDLTGVTATSAGNAWAVGTAGAGGAANVVLHWDGSGWTMVTSPAPEGSLLEAVATTPGGFVWAAGESARSSFEPVAVRLQGVPQVLVVVQGSDGHVYLTGPREGLATTGVSVAAGTSLAAARDGNGGVEAVWQGAGTHHLWALDPAGHQADTGLSVAAGTSPAVTALPGGGFEIAFDSAADGQTWVLGPGGPARNAAPGLAAAAGTSPAIASNAAGGVKIAVHGAGSDHLWLISGGGTAREISVGLAAGTSPAIAASPEGFTTAFVNAADGTLWWVRNDGSVGQVGDGVAVAPGTSPAIAVADGARVEMAVRGANGDLWVSDDDHGLDAGVPMLTGTSPAIAAAGGGFEEEVQAPSRDLVTDPAIGPAVNTSVLMAAGTSPAAPTTFPLQSLVPDVLSVDQSVAEDWITDAGLTIGAIAPDNGCKAFAGTVLTQGIDPWMFVTPGTPVNLTVSTGKDAHDNPCIIK